MGPRRNLLPIAMLAAAAIGLAPGAGAARQEFSCMGHPATIVAEHFQTYGTRGDDVIVDPEKGGLVQARGGDDLICLAGGDKEVYGERGDDWIQGGRSDDYIDGGAGEDTIDGGAGEDFVFDLDNADDTLSGGPGEDDIAFSRPYHRLSPPVHVDLAAGRASGHGDDNLAGFEDIEGTGKRDVIRGDEADNFIDGVRGGDRILGAGGDDTILGARLLVTEIGIADHFDGADSLLSGGAGDDRIFGGAGPDILSGGPGSDLLDGGGPSDRPGDGGVGGGGRDTCRGLEAARGCERLPGSD
jgi:Ca2+-binding RTX toxin-like protein